jgi:riboflavin synthase
VFTGLVQAVGVVRDIVPTASGSRLVVDPADLRAASAPAPDFEVGESISVCGVCLTLAAPTGNHGGLLAFDAVPETLRRTSLARLQAGSRVNLERSVTPSTLMGGHVVQGHVDGLAEVVRVQQGDDWRLRLRPLPLADANPMEYLVPKGSVTLDGVSLTVAALGSDESNAPPAWFEVALIPTTLDKTTLGDLHPGDRLNIEFDALAKTIVHWLRHFGPTRRR